MNSFKYSIDIVLPMFNEQSNIVLIIDYITKTLKNSFSKLNFLLIDDGSIDETEREIEKLCVKNKDVSIKYFRLSKNYGQDLAIKCGIDHSTSDVCAILDADFQHPPEKILEAFQKIKSGFNIVHVMKKEHHIGSKYRKIGSFLFNKVINFLSGIEINLTDFKVLDKRAVKKIKKFRETNYFSRGIIDLIGLKSSRIYYEPQKRKFGYSKYSFLDLVRLAFSSIFAFSIKPLRIAIYGGFFISAVSFIYGLYILYEKIFLGQPIPGFPTLATAMFFLGGIQLLFLGILGEYIGKTFLESKRRPQYIIEYVKEIKG